MKNLNFCKYQLALVLCGWFSLSVNSAAQTSPCTADSVVSKVLVHFFGGEAEDKPCIPMLVGTSPDTCYACQLSHLSHPKYALIWMVSLPHPEKLSKINLMPDREGYIADAPNIISFDSINGECVGYVKFKFEKAWRAFITADPAVPIRLIQENETIANTPRHSPKLRLVDTLVVGLKCSTAMVDTIYDFKITMGEIKVKDSYKASEISRKIADEVPFVRGKYGRDGITQAINDNMLAKRLRFELEVQ